MATKKIQTIYVARILSLPGGTAKAFRRIRDRPSETTVEDQEVPSSLLGLGDRDSPGKEATYTLWPE